MLHSLAPSPLLFPFHQQPSALLVCELLFCFCWRVDCCVEWLFLHGDFLIEFPVCSRGVRTVVYIPLSTYRRLLHTVVYVPVYYSWCCQVLEVPQNHGGYRTATVFTLFHYCVVHTVLMVLSCTWSTTVPSWLPYNSTTVLPFHPAALWRHDVLQYLQYSFLLLSLH